MDTSLTVYGYAVPKSQLSSDQQKELRECKELNIMPFHAGAPVKTTIIFPIYRESATRFYLPRFYGAEKFGPPKTISLPVATPINLKFNGTLRPIQQEAINAFKLCIQNGHGSALIEMGTGKGKTGAGLYLIAEVIKQKTLVICHKDFLATQWRERIQQFLPNARIGLIQGPTVDVADKDIVLCMLQSLCQKTYPSSTFDGFGFTVIDEVHHISSETFSQALFKIVTRYSLGLSATMTRKDGTTNAYKRFLGDICYSNTDVNDFPVEVWRHNFSHSSPDYSETITDYRGQPMYGSMLVKLSKFVPRTEEIIKLMLEIQVNNRAEYDAHAHDGKQTCEKCQQQQFLVHNTCCNCIKYCLNCTENVPQKLVQKRKRNVVGYKNKETGSIVTRINTEYITKEVWSKDWDVVFGDWYLVEELEGFSRCPNCTKRMKVAQNYIPNPHLKPIDQSHVMIVAHNLALLEFIYKRVVSQNLIDVGYYVGGMKEAALKESEKKRLILATYQMVSEGLDIPSLSAIVLATPMSDVVQTCGRILRMYHEKHIIVDIVDSHPCFLGQWSKRSGYYRKQKFRIVGSPLAVGGAAEVTADIDIEDDADEVAATGKCLIDLDDDESSATAPKKCLISLDDNESSGVSVKPVACAIARPTTVTSSASKYVAASKLPYKPAYNNARSTILKPAYKPTSTRASTTTPKPVVARISLDD